jgi:hypothetical protein
MVVNGDSSGPTLGAGLLSKVAIWAALFYFFAYIEFGM